MNIYPAKKAFDPFILALRGDGTGEAVIRWWDWLNPPRFLLLPIDTKGECGHKGQVPLQAVNKPSEGLKPRGQWSLYV